METDQLDMSFIAAQEFALMSPVPFMDPAAIYTQICAVRSFLTDVITPSVVNVVKFSKNLPGFCALPQVSYKGQKEDGRTMLKAKGVENSELE